MNLPPHRQPISETLQLQAPEDQQAPLTATAPLSTGRVLGRGLTWSVLGQLLQALASAAVMIVLVRVIPPAEYGKAAAASSWLAFLSAFGFDQFVLHSLQLTGDEEPRWSLHWSAGFYIQAGLAAICALLALIFHFFANYRALSPVLLLASLGLFIQWPGQLRFAMLRRLLDFRRIRLLQLLGTIVGLASSLVLGLRGWGALAIVFGTSLMSLPFAADLLIVVGWRPDRKWWEWPTWSAYKESLNFGSKLAISGILFGARATLEALMLPVAIGFVQMGFVSRAQALYNLTFGRVAALLTEVVYPLLPRAGSDLQRYRRHATVLLQVILLITIPGSVFLGVAGQPISRALYGTKWIAADPLLLPAALLAGGIAVFSVSVTILQALNKMKVVVLLSALFAALTALPLGLAIMNRNAESYLWSLALAQFIGTSIALRLADPFLSRGWPRLILLPVLVASLISAGLLWELREFLESNAILGAYHNVGRAIVLTIAFTFFMGFAHQTIFPRALDATLEQLPAGRRIQGWLAVFNLRHLSRLRRRI